jgi:hypothetical protein
VLELLAIVLVPLACALDRANDGSGPLGRVATWRRWDLGGGAGGAGDLA